MRNPNNYIFEIPKINPLSPKYVEFWKKQKEYCIKGYWADGYYCPPKLFFYANHCHILLNDKGKNVKEYKRPFLRDLEWEIHYAIMVARGFSGFEDDPYVSCLEKLRFTPEEELQELSIEYPEILSENGYKRYMDPLEYIKLKHREHWKYPLYKNQAKNFMWLTARGIGKALDLMSLVYDVNGPRTIGSLSVGDWIYDDKGELVCVIAIDDNEADYIYKVKFNDGRVVYTHANHDWDIYDIVNNRDPKKEVISTLDLMSKVDSTKKRGRYFVANTMPVKYPKKETYIDPYLLGILIGDGTLKEDLVFTTNDNEIVSFIKDIIGAEYSLTRKDSISYRITSKAKENSIKRYIKKIKLNVNSSDKFIPNEYLYSDIDTRMALLQGLMDSDGSISKKGHISYSTCSYALYKDFMSLCRSLGIKVTATKIDLNGDNRNYPTYVISLFTNNIVFRLSRKKERQKIKSKLITDFSSIHSIEKINDKRLTRCIQVNNESSLFLTNEYTVTHNSYIVSSIILHEWLFDGVMDYEDYIAKKKLNTDNTEYFKSTVLIGAGQASYSNETMLKAKESLSRLSGGYTVGNVHYPPPFYKQWKGGWEAGSKVEASYKKKVAGTWKEAGSKSSILNKTFADNPFAGQGSRNSIIVLEEVGMFNNLISSLSALTENMKFGGTIKFGTAILVGTGGAFGGRSGIDSQRIFYDPDTFDMLSFNDEWEGKGQIGYFSPAYMGLDKYRDKNGYINKDKAIKELLAEREKKKKSKDKTALDNLIQYQPLIPSEVFLSREGNFFPVFEIKKRITNIERNNISTLIERKVDLYFDKENYNGVNYKVDIDNKLKAIDSFPHKKEDDKEGAVVIYEFPQYDETGKVPEGLYVIGHDPYRVDGEGDSLATIYVMKTKKYFNKYGHDQIVATYFGRPYMGRDVVNDILMKLALFYNSKVWFENNVGNVKEFFEKKKRLDLLALKPNSVFNKQASFTKGQTLEYGYSISNDKVKLEALSYLRDWLLEERSRIEEISIKEQFGETAYVENQSVSRNLDIIPCKATLQELASFNLFGNFDRVMGMIGCVLAMEETYNKYTLKPKDNGFNINMSFITKNKTIFKNDNISKATTFL